MQEVIYINQNEPLCASLIGLYPEIYVSKNLSVKTRARPLRASRYSQKFIRIWESKYKN